MRSQPLGFWCPEKDHLEDESVEDDRPEDGG
jgi:hypothetical protein